ncbi:tetratricopeptide repeat protein, partial [Brunnivagina elsteri]
MIKRLWQWLKRIWQRFKGKKQAVSLQKSDAKEKPRWLLTDAEYESLFLQLLAGVNDEGWSRGRVSGFLAGKNIVESDLVGWLRRFGERLLARDGENRELAMRMVRLSEVDCGVLGEVAGEIGRELLGREGETEEEEKGEAEVWFERGLQQLEVEDYEASIVSFDRALKIKPDLHEAWYKSGNALVDLGRNEEAIASYDEALKFKPDYHQAWYNRGNALANLGRNEEAIASYDEALKFKPDDHEAWNNRGVPLANLGRNEDAIASYDEALKFKPDFHQAWSNRGNALANLGRYEDAIAS